MRSAGSTPADQLNRAVVEAMQEVGVDLSHEFPKPLTDEFVRDADVVITMGCGDTCPVYPGKRYEDWDLPDPAGQDLETVREIRNEIDRRVQPARQRASRPPMKRAGSSSSPPRVTRYAAASGRQVTISRSSVPT